MNEAGLLATLKFDTRELPVEHQFEAWRAFHSSVIDVSISPEARRGFIFEQQVWDLGKLAFTSSRMPGPKVPRKWHHFGKDPLDHWCVVLPESAAHATQDPDAPPRQVHFRSLGRPYDGAAADSSVSTVYIPRDLLRPLAGVLDKHPGTVGPDGLGGLLADFLVSFERRLPHIPAHEVPNAIEAMRAMISACLAPTADRIAEAQGHIAATMLERARQMIHKELYAPDLGPAMLCRQLGISRSKLYVLFEPLHGVARYIQRQRLLAAYKELSDPSSVTSVARIAEKLCFADAATFSRAFRSEMGCAPSEVRAAAAIGLPLSPRRLPLKVLNQVVSLGEILQYLQV